MNMNLTERRCTYAGVLLVFTMTALEIIAQAVQYSYAGFTTSAIGGHID